MKILKLCYEFPPIGGGGAKVVYGLSREKIATLGYDIDLVTMGFNKLSRYDKVNRVNVYRVPCIRVDRSTCSIPEMVSYALSAIPTVLKLVRKNKYHINHTHFIPPDGLVSLILKKVAELPYIITAHGSDVPGYNPDRFKLGHKLFSPVWRKIVRNTEQIVCPSGSLKSLVSRYGLDTRITVIPNGIDANKFQPYGNKQKRMLLVSRIFERNSVLSQGLGGTRP